MDRRVKYTKKVIKDTFIDLLDKKDISKVTVSEICKIADVNRATFYRYYLDVFDLLEKMEQEFVEDVKAAYGTKDSEKQSLAYYATSLLNMCYDNQKLAKILFTSTGKPYFLNSILEECYNRCKVRWIRAVPDIDEDDIEYASVFIFNGALGVVNYWIKCDFDKSVDDVAKIIQDLAHYGLDKFIYKK
jgi:AcrR family transcriptional regulator